MVTKEDLVFRQLITLRDGTRVLIRPLLKEDRQALLDLYLPVTYEERRYMRHDVNDPEVISGWVDNLDYERVLPFIAVVGERIVGNATLHFKNGPARHRCELRIFLAKDFRRRGLGTKLLQSVIDHARRLSMYLIEVFIVSEHVEVIKAMQKANFETVCTIEDYFMMPDGGLRDVKHLVLRLKSPVDEF